MLRTWEEVLLLHEMEAIPDTVPRTWDYVLQLYYNGYSTSMTTNDLLDYL